MATRFSKPGSNILVIPVLVLPLFLVGCVSYTVQKALVGGPVVRTPIRLAADKTGGDFELMPHVAVPFDTTLKASSPGASSEPEFTWTLPTIDAGLYAEKALSNHWVIGVGMNYSRISHDNKSENLFGGQASLGVYWSQPKWGLRTDVSLIRQQSYHDFEILIEDESLPDIVEADDGQSTSFTGSFSVALNSNVESWPANVFVSWQVGSNSFYESIAMERTFSMNYYSYSLGVFRNLGDRVRVAAGVRSGRGQEISWVGQVDSVNELIMQISFKAP